MATSQQMYEDMLRIRDADKFCWDSMTANDMTVDNLDEKKDFLAVVTQKGKAIYVCDEAHNAAGLSSRGDVVRERHLWQLLVTIGE